MTLFRQLEAADLGPNMIEIPVNDKDRTGQALAATTNNDSIRENATSMPSRNGSESGSRN